MGGRSYSSGTRPVNQRDDYQPQPNRIELPKQKSRTGEYWGIAAWWMLLWFWLWWVFLR